MATPLTAYLWEARTRTGETKKGVMEAENEEAVHNKLKLQLMQPVLVKKQPKQLSFQFGTGVNTSDIVIFTRLFATMIDAGLPIVQCLHILSSQAEAKVFQKIIGNLKDDVESGSMLADAIRKHPRVFTDLYSSMVQAGETGGILDTILVRLANYLEKAAKLKSKIKGAMIYPACIVSAAILVTAVLFLAALRT